MPIAFQNLPFDEAIKYLRDKINLPSEHWTDLWQGMHSRAFVVAGAMKNDLLADIHKSVVDAIAQGTTLQQFKKDFAGIVAKHGWTGSALSPVDTPGKLGWRAGVIFNTNMRTAYSAGGYKQMTDPAVLKARPYWRYIGGLSERPRPLHLSWSGTILDAGDPWWGTHYPPNGWGCKCKVVSAGNRDLKRNGWKVADKAPDDGTRDWTNPKTGEVVQVPNGIDPGWAYNPGKAAWGRNEQLRLMEDAGPWRELGPRYPGYYGVQEKLRQDTPVAEIGDRVQKGDVRQLRGVLADVLGGDSAFFEGPDKEKILVTQAVVDHILENPEKRWDGREAYFPFIPELIEDPAEIWYGFAESEISGRVAIRKKYVKEIDLGKGKALGLVGETQNGQWQALTFFRGGLKGLSSLRKGRLAYARD